MRSLLLVLLIGFLPIGMTANAICDEVLATANIEKMNTPVEMQITLDMSVARQASPDFRPHESLRDMIMSWHFRSGFEGLSGQGTVLAALYLSQWDGVQSISLKANTASDTHAFQLDGEPNDISIKLPVEPSGRIRPISTRPVLPGVPSYEGPREETRVGIPKQPRQTILIPFFGTKKDILKVADLSKFDSASLALICNLLACEASRNADRSDKIAELFEKENGKW